MELNSHYIELNEVLKHQTHHISINQENRIKILQELHINQEEEIIIKGSYDDWCIFCNLLINEVVK